MTSNDLNPLLRRLSDSHNNFRVCMEMWLAGSRREALPGLLEHLTLEQQALVMPWKEFYSCQSAIKQCFRLEGNTDK